MASLIKLKSVTKKFNDTKQNVLDDISIDICDGDYVAIVGPSGSGKSTLLSIVGLLENITNGHYFLQGHDVAKLTRSQLRELRNTQIGWVFQNFNLIGSMTCIENVSLPLRYNNTAKRDSYLVRAQDVLSSVGLLDKQDEYPEKLSGGQQQRIAIARALINKPALIVADEPTGNLDSKTSQLIMSLFKELNEQGVTILIVTHDPDIAKQCDYQVQLHDGQVVNAN